ncbi:hypothetical protein TA3x_001904 [Tundrisphaera sp. TA3]|uniref:hypothetical protein n=1 Tax=Tundrisphaera sp. TA3 TaxID=3435775 RepID=UPI003EBD26BB
MPEELNIAVVQPPAVAAAPRRISWAAVFAGVTVTLCAQLLLSLLGLAIGASTIHPLREQDPAAGLGVGAGIWFVATGLISLFAGGWTAGRLAGVPRGVDSTLHGVLTWGLATLLTFYLLTTAMGALIGGAARGLGTVASALGQGAASVSPEISGAVRREMQERGVDWDGIRDEATKLLRETGKPELQPEAIKDQGEKAKADAKDSAKAAGENPQASDDEFNALLERFYNRGSDVANAADREALVNVLAARTGKSKEEAGQIVDRWEATYQKARKEAERLKAEAGQKAREAGDAASKGVSRAAFWSFLGLLGGLIAAALGGRAAAPSPLAVGVGSASGRL